MKFLFINQTFYPDVMATGQYLAEVAEALVQRGHEVAVLTSNRAYDDPAKRFPKTEIWRGIQIHRIAGTGFGKGAKWKRALDFGSFLVASWFRLLFAPRPDVIVALTSPPLISVLGAAAAKLRRSQFVYWVMDFNPDEAIAAGWLEPKSLLAKFLEALSRFSLRSAAKILVLDRFMRDRIVAKGIAAEKIAVLPLWSHDEEVRFDAAGREAFRKRHGLSGKFVVMYSGNHSPCHPLTTLIEAARKMAKDTGLIFCFVGGGSEFRRLQEVTQREALPNVLLLPYQPLNELSASLSAADLQTVVMGNDFVGLVHPCKIYNLLRIGSPVLYIGPNPSHVTDIAAQLNGTWHLESCRHGDLDALIECINRARSRNPGPEQKAVSDRFSQESGLPNLVRELESLKAASST